MVRLSAILNWNGYHNIPKKFIQRRMFKGVVYGKRYSIAGSFSVMLNKFLLPNKKRIIIT